MAVQKYQQRVPVVDAILYTGTNQNEILAWCPEATYTNGHLYLYNGTVEVRPNEWILTGVCGNWSKFGSCFTDAYDPIT